VHGAAAETLSIGLLAITLAIAVVRPRGLSEAVVAVPAAVALVATDVVPLHAATQRLREIGPTVGFLAAILVFGHLCAEAGVFDYLGSLAANASRGNAPRLLALVVTIAAAVTAVLTLDATVVLLTPVVLRTATRLGVPARPHAYACTRLANSGSLLLPVSNLTKAVTAVLTLDATVVLLTPVVLRTATRLGVPARPHAYACTRLANSGSLLLPVSNLTNLLAFTASGLSFGRFAALMVLPWLVACAAEWLGLRVFFRGDLVRSVAAPTQYGPPHRALRWSSSRRRSPASSSPRRCTSPPHGPRSPAVSRCSCRGHCGAMCIRCVSWVRRVPASACSCWPSR